MSNSLSAVPKCIVVFSGGSAANSLVDVFSHLSETKGLPLSYIIPISDNGGSSSELIRVFGGPGRLVRLIPDNGHDPERTAIKSFFNHRLALDSGDARLEWLDIVEARHALWQGISSEKKELIRSFLNLLNLEIVKRARPSSVYNFSSASIGNMFLTGARLFSGSLESAIYLLSSICTIPARTSVLPAINTNFSHHISAVLTDGTSIPGQNAISHPSAPTAVPAAQQSASGPPPQQPSQSPTQPSSPTALFEPEDANPTGTLLTLRTSQIHFTKAQSAHTPTLSVTPSSPASPSTPTAPSPAHADLPARISHITYINPYGQPIRPSPNPKVLSALASASAIIYSIGSLYTSIVPSLILRGVGRAIAGPHLRSSSNSSSSSSSDRPKILILNGSLDRETGPPPASFSAVDFVAAIARAGCESSRGTVDAPAPAADRDPHPHPDPHPDLNTHPHRDPKGRNSTWRAYVTHVVYLDGHGAPHVDRGALADAGIESVRLYGRLVEGQWRYDEVGLAQALAVLIADYAHVVGLRGDKSRRNTLEG